MHGERLCDLLHAPGHDVLDQEPEVGIDVSLTQGVIVGWLVAQTLEGPFSAVSKLIFAKTRSLICSFFCVWLCSPDMV